MIDRVIVITVNGIVKEEIMAFHSSSCEEPTTTCPFAPASLTPRRSIGWRHYGGLPWS